MMSSPAAEEAPTRVEPADDEAALWRELKERGTSRARERLFLMHQPFAHRLALTRPRHGPSADIDRDDLRQIACSGLLECIDRYDPALGVPFRGYAAKVIAGRLADGLAKSSELRQQFSHRARVRRERCRSLAEGSPADGGSDALSALVDLAVGLALGFMLEDEGFSRCPDAADVYPSAYQSLLWRETLGRLHAALDALDAREQFILRQHYLEGLAFEQIAAVLDLSKGRISQLHRAALVTLRSRLRSTTEFALEG